ncbi:MAG: hypothetical protein JWR52_2619 [Marmoricola sp.]|nr:hypothetical protein [Marmoricola sp.]
MRHASRVKSAPLALAVVLALTVAGCGGTAASTTPPTPTNSLLPSIKVATLSGRLIAVGGPVASDAPLAGTITITGPGGSVVHAAVSRTGAFQIQLSPGTYRLSGRSPQFGGGTTDCHTATPTTILVADRTVTADILCQRR